MPKSAAVTMPAPRGVENAATATEMAMMTADPKEAREKRPQALQHVPVLQKPFRIEQVPRLLREPVLPL